MSRILTLLVALSRRWLRDRTAVFFALLFPIILLVIFSTAFAGGSPDFALSVQNEDVGPDGRPTELSAAFVDSLENVSVLTVHRLGPDRNLTAWSRDDGGPDVRRVLVVPDGFAGSVRNRSLRVRTAVIEDTIDLVEDRLPPARASQVRRTVSGVRNGTNATGPVTISYLTTPADESAPVVRGIVDTVVFRFNQRAIGVEEPTVEVAAGDLGGTDLGAADYYLPAFVAAIVLINGVMTVPAVVAGFRSDGTFKRLVATPLRRRDWIVANLLQQAILGVVLLGVMVVVARVLFGVTALPGPLSVLLVLLGAAAFAALGMTLGNFIADPDAATSLGGAVAFPMMFLSGVFWELDVMPSWLQTVGEVMPLYHFHRGLQQLMIRDSTEGLLVPVAVLGAMAVVFGALAVATTDWTDLGD